MTFEQAYHAMNCGGRVRRKSWDDERFVRVTTRPVDEIGYPWMPRPDDVEANDWEFLQ